MQGTQSATAISFENEELFEDLETYCMFIGYPRSGHSLIGSSLDAHPNIIIAHELNVLKHIYAGFNKSQIYQLLLENSQTRAEAGRGTGRYSYQVPNQWQGTFQKLRVIGDKQGGGSTRHLSRHPDSLERLRDTIDLKIKFIHVVRNPYDNISTIAARNNWSLEDGTERYFSLCEKIGNIKKQIATVDLFELQHESFIDNPQVLLKELCRFLGQDAPDDYLNDCASIVYKSPHRSRYDTQWDLALIGAVKDKIAEFPFLKGYSFES
jgi:hypothetical protein